MKWTNEHLAFRESLEKFVEKEINPHCDEWEKEGIFPAHELFKKMGDLGFLGITKEEEYGGLNLDLSYSLLMAEVVGQINSGGVSLAIGVQTDMCTPALSKFGSDALKKEFLAPAIAGDSVGCIGVSESGGGSDVAALKTTARKDGDDYIINGEKMWITNAVQADWMCMLAITGEGAVHQNKSLIMVPMDTKGIHVEKKLDKMGMRSSDTAQVFFEDVRVPRRNLIGEMEGLGFMQQMAQFQDERLWGAANACAGIANALEITKQYTRERHTFGQPLLDNQFVHFKLAELSTEVEALKSLIYRTADLYMASNELFDKEVVRLASMAKYKAGKLAREACDWCLQFHGGMGYMMDTQINRFYRDSRLTSIGAGADEIMLGIICKMEGTLPRKKK